MLDPAYPAASGFMWLTAAFFLVAFAVPLLVVPLAWARTLGWTLPEDRLLAVYLARCLGAVALTLVTAGFVAATDPHRHAIVLVAYTVAGALLLAVHVWGAIRKEQPWAENAEIALYVVATGASAWFAWQVW